MRRMHLHGSGSKAGLALAGSHLLIGLLASVTVSTRAFDSRCVAHARPVSAKSGMCRWPRRLCLSLAENGFVSRQEVVHLAQQFSISLGDVRVELAREVFEFGEHGPVSP